MNVAHLCKRVVRCPKCDIGKKTRSGVLLHLQVIHGVRLPEAESLSAQAEAGVECRLCDVVVADDVALAVHLESCAANTSYRDYAQGRASSFA